MNLTNILRNHQPLQQPYIPPFTTRVPETGCARDCACCHGASSIIQNNYLEPLETDNEALKEVKRYWNNSWYSCQPNYMNGVEQYRILNKYPEEIRLIRKLWEKHEEATETNPLGILLNRKARASRKIFEFDAKLRKKLGVMYHFLEYSAQNPGKTVIINAAWVSFTVLFFFTNLSTTIGAAAVTSTLLGVSYLTYNKTHIYIHYLRCQYV